MTSEELMQKLMNALAEDATDRNTFANDALCEFEEEHNVDIKNIDYKDNILSLEIDNKWYLFEVSFKKVAGGAL